MVCLRCKLAVESALKEAAIPYGSVELGRVWLKSQPTTEEKKALERALAPYDLQLMEDRKDMLVEQIKIEILRLLHASHPPQLKLSAHLSQVLDYHYTYLSNLFSELEGITLERYFISQRVERIKELIIYEEASLANIAEELHYSGVSHLCQQFRKVTGLTPSEFRKLSKTEEFVWRTV